MGSGGSPLVVPGFVNEFWTARQRQASSLQEISYRACFKPQLPRFFIERLTRPGDIVHDPFMGRGTTLVESALTGRVPSGCDINPLSEYLVGPRLTPPDLDEVKGRLDLMDLEVGEGSDPLMEDLLVFYHPRTLGRLHRLRAYLLQRRQEGMLDGVDRWIWMVALNRLTGHSPGFFSVYTLPPNQAASPTAQRKINRDRNQVPPERDIKSLILKKSKQLLRDVTPGVRETLRQVAPAARLIIGPAEDTRTIPGGTVSLVVTSPPFLDVVNYKGDNWLRCWFIGVDSERIQITAPGQLGAWQTAMTRVFHELARILAPGGWVAFEVGEVRGGTIRLEETVLPCGAASGLIPEGVLINDQDFTKTANCWGVDNRSKGTNTNRVVLFSKAL